MAEQRSGIVSTKKTPDGGEIDTFPDGSTMSYSKAHLDHFKSLSDKERTRELEKDPKKQKGKR